MEYVSRGNPEDAQILQAKAEAGLNVGPRHFFFETAPPEIGVLHGGIGFLLHVEPAGITLSPVTVTAGISVLLLTSIPRPN